MIKQRQILMGARDWLVTMARAAMGGTTLCHVMTTRTKCHAHRIQLGPSVQASLFILVNIM